MKDDCLNELVVKVKALLEGTRSTARCDRVLPDNTPGSPGV
jgi:hypothetical protein